MIIHSKLMWDRGRANRCPPGGMFGGRSNLFILFCLLFTSTLGTAQVGLGGFNAVMTVPTARFLPNGHVAVGIGYIPKPYAIFDTPEHDNLAYFATVGFLPSLEISLRATQSFNTTLPSIGDRVASVRVRFLSEKGNRPALALGVHDMATLLDREVGANNWFHAFYLVATKMTTLPSQFNLEATIGYGVDWIPAPSYEFAGVFGGISIGYRHTLFIKGEYDANRFNYGFGLSVLGILNANLILIDGQKLGFGANINKRL